MEEERNLYGVCPKCSALMKNGVCSVCGEGKEAVEGTSEETANSSSPVPYVGYGSSYGKPAGENKKGPWGLIAGVCAGVAVFLILLFISLRMIIGGAKETSFSWKELTENVGDKIGEVMEEIDRRIQERENNRPSEVLPAQKEPEEVPDDKEYEEDMADTCYAGKYSTYVPSLQDEFYVEIVDSMREDLSYQVEWKEFDVENIEESIGARGVYPQLSGSIPHLEELNAYIEESVLYYKELLGVYGQQEDHESGYCESVCYITYMDEDIISIVLREEVTLGNYKIPQLHDINIDLHTGTVMEHEQMLEYSDKLAKRFREQNRVQNSGSPHINTLSTKEIRQLLAGYEGTLFYTPVGLEIGFNYDMEEEGILGWVTVTLKEYDSYRKKF